MSRRYVPVAELPPLAPDDPRHETERGYSLGCRLACCRTAHADYTRERNHRRGRHQPRAVVLATHPCYQPRHGTYTRRAKGCKCEKCAPLLAVHRARFRTFSCASCGTDPRPLRRRRCPGCGALLCPACRQRPCSAHGESGAWQATG